MARHACYLLLTCLLCVFCVSAQRRGQKSSPDSLIARGEAALRQGRYAEAKTFFEEAEKLPGVDEAEVNAGLALAELQLGHYEAARQREAKVLQLVSKPHELAEAHNLIGTAWLRESYETPAPLKTQGLRTAEEEFRQALALDPLFDSAYFNLGTVLSQQGHAAGAAAAFKASIEAASKNPESAGSLPLERQGLAPAFAAADSQGRTVSLESLRGRFVLLDFWATWCPPCIRALPIIRQLATFFPVNQFALISIDEDSDNRPRWSSFTSQQNMDWTQIWDQNSRIYYGFHSFGLAAPPDMILPRYVFIDPEGFLLHIYTGTDRVGTMAGEIVRTVNAAHADSRTRLPEGQSKKSAEFRSAPVEEVLGDNARLLDDLLFLRAHNQPNELRHAPSERRRAARSLAEYQGR
jgi:thiol-disulfide isomerase/thioredoxin